MYPLVPLLKGTSEREIMDDLKTIWIWSCSKIDGVSCSKLVFLIIFLLWTMMKSDCLQEHILIWETRPRKSGWPWTSLGRPRLGNVYVFKSTLKGAPTIFKVLQCLPDLSLLSFSIGLPYKCTTPMLHVQKSRQKEVTQWGKKRPWTRCVWLQRLCSFYSALLLVASLF